MAAVTMARMAPATSTMRPSSRASFGWSRRSAKRCEEPPGRVKRYGEPIESERELDWRLREGIGLVDVIRAMDVDGVVVDDIELRAPTLDDVFLAKTGRTLEGAATGEDGASAR